MSFDLKEVNQNQNLKCICFLNICNEHFLVVEENPTDLF